MTNRQALLDQKAVAITQILERWAKEEKILAPGEQIAFTLSITSTPLVVRLSSVKPLGMKPTDFFTKQRLLSAGVPVQQNHVRIENLLRNHIAEIPTMRHLTSLTAANLCRQWRAGIKTIRAIQTVLVANGLTLTAFRKE